MTLYRKRSAGLLRLLAASAAVAALAIPSGASAGSVQSVEVGTSGALSFRLPPGWSSSVGGATATAPTITARPGDGRDAVLLMTAIPRRSDESLSAPELMRLVEARGEAALSTALQEQVELVEVRGAQAVGYLYHLTDRQPESGPGDYREARQGAVLVGELVLSVTILTHSDDAKSVAEALDVLSGARHAPGAGR